MWWLVQAGGVPVLFVIVFGGWALVLAGLLLRTPSRRRVEAVEALARATLYSTLCGFAADLMAVCLTVTREGFAEPLVPSLLIGLGESLSPLVLGFGLLSLVAFLTGLGVRRLPDEAA